MEFDSAMIEQVNGNPLYRATGIRIETAKDGIVTARLEPPPAMCWPFPGQPHGGILFTLMDTTMAWAAIAGQKEFGSCTTIHADIQYTRPARGSVFTCRAEVVSQTTRISFIQSTITDAAGALLAMGQGTYRIMKMPLV
ncbi:MAG: PaaI family thioesterase [Thermodesulfobacteriota bacterium]